MKVWTYPPPDETFRDAVRQEFGALARECGVKLVEVETMIFGFCTPYAVLTIGAYPGHFRGICVKFRRRERDEAVCVNDGVDIGLANIEELVTGRCSAVHTARRRWASDEIWNEVAGLASVTRQVAMSFLITPNGDWTGLRAHVDEKIRNAPKPWRGLYEEMG